MPDSSPSVQLQGAAVPIETSETTPLSLKPRSRSLTPCSDGGMKGSSPASGTSRGSLKRELEEEEDDMVSECELEIADSGAPDGRTRIKTNFNDGAVTNSDAEVRT